MGEFNPVRTIADLDTLDHDEIVEGYMDGFGGEPEPGNNRSRSYWHGWRNGAVDGRHREKDEAQAALAREVVASWPKPVTPDTRRAGT
jgi:hypothetical protein